MGIVNATIISIITITYLIAGANSLRRKREDDDKGNDSAVRDKWKGR